MDEFQGLTALGLVGELHQAFSTRLSGFWTDILRQAPNLFVKIYGEATQFEEESGQLSRKYAVVPSCVDDILARAKMYGINFLPPDPYDTLNRHEVVNPEWWQIKH